MLKLKNNFAKLVKYVLLSINLKNYNSEILSLL